jgi:hypothetical protein
MRRVICAGGVQPLRDDDRMAWHTNNSHMLQAARPQVARQPRRAALHILSMPGLRAYARKADELGEFADEALSGGSGMRYRLIAGETAKRKGANLRRSGGGSRVLTHSAKPALLKAKGLGRSVR